MELGKILIVLKNNKGGKMNSIKKLNKAQLCVGCGICKAALNDCVDLKLGETGKFSIENTKDWTEENEKIFKKLCPVLAPGAISDCMWGKTNGVFYGWSNDVSVRYEASSGGIISQTLKYLLKKNMVDAVLHIEKDMENPLKNKAVVCTNEAEIMRGAGSRYAPAVLLKHLPQVLKTYKRVAVVGKPCDIRAVKNYASEHNEVADRIVYTFSFFCGGMPSEKASERVVEKLGGKLNDVLDISYRGNGWPGYASVTTKNGDVLQMSYVDSWGKILGRDIHRYCKFCVDGISELADFTCGDGWYETESGYPSHEEHDGRNIILVRTEKGKKLLNEMNIAGEISLDPITDYEAVLNNIQPGQLARRQILKARIVPMKIFKQYLPKYPMKCLRNWEKDVDKKYRLRVSLGTIKRLLKGTL